MEKALPMKKEKVKRKIHWKRFLPVYLLALPGVIYLIINNYLPMFGVVIAFKDLDFRKGILFSDWAGLQNFQYLFQSSDAWQITRNTVCYNLAFIVLNAVLGIAVAIFLNEVRGKLATRFYQSIMLVPFLISWVVVSYLAYAFLATDTGFGASGPAAHFLVYRGQVLARDSDLCAGVEIHRLPVRDLLFQLDQHQHRLLRGGHH